MTTVVFSVFCSWAPFGHLPAAASAAQFLLPLSRRRYTPRSIWRPSAARDCQLERIRSRRHGHTTVQL